MMLIRTIIAHIVLSVFVCCVVTEEKRNWFNMDITRNHEHIDLSYQRCTGSCNENFCKINVSCRLVNRTSKIRRHDIYFNDGIVLEAPVLLNVSTYKKFATQYRPLMLTATKIDICKQLTSRNHPFFAFFGVHNTNGNVFDPCPLSGHRYEAPTYTSTLMGTLVPTGEWRADFILSKVINGIEEHIFIVSHYVIAKF